MDDNQLQNTTTALEKFLLMKQEKLKDLESKLELESLQGCDEYITKKIAAYHQEIQGLRRILNSYRTKLVENLWKD